MRNSPQNKNPAPSFPALVQMFFTLYLVEQRALSSQTIAAYRDAFLLFLNFAQKQLGKLPTELLMTDITPELILAFLDFLEHERHNSIRSRNARLAALRAFLKYAGRHDMSSIYVVERALGVPMKRFERPMLGYLSREEMLAVIGEPGKSWTSQRDHLLLGLLYNTGARVSEIIGIRVVDVVLSGAACVHLLGKGRKQRSMPLWPSIVLEIRAWLRLNPNLGDVAALLPNRYGHAMTRSNVVKRLRLAVHSAEKTSSSLTTHHISPHTIRHTTAMHLLQSGVKIEVVSLWLGHENPAASHMYVEADLAMKEQALAHLQDPSAKVTRYHASDELLEFLKTL